MVLYNITKKNKVFEAQSKRIMCKKKKKVKYYSMQSASVPGLPIDGGAVRPLARITRDKTA